MKVMAPQVEKEEVEVDEAMSSYDRNRKESWCSTKSRERKALSKKQSKTGVVPGVGYVSQ